MNFSEKILLACSKKDQKVFESTFREEWDEASALELLKRVYPNFLTLIREKVICDFGCGAGFQSIAMAKEGARRIIGIEYNAKRLAFAKNLSEHFQMNNHIDFFERVEDSLFKKCDIVISQNSMEHFSNPIGILRTMKNLIHDKGMILITFGPPWFAPYGSHMQFFTNIPWVNIFFSEKTVMNVRMHFRNDGATRYEEVESGLNKMTIAKFEKIIRQSGLKIQYKKYEVIKKLNFLGTIPFIRELVINHVTCSLVKNI